MTRKILHVLQTFIFKADYESSIAGPEILWMGLFFLIKVNEQKAVKVVCVWCKVKLHCVEETLSSFPCGVFGRASVTESAGPAGDSVNTGTSKVLRGQECGLAVDVLLFVHPVHVLGNQTLHHGSFWLQDLQQKIQILKWIWSKVQIIFFHKELHTVYIVPIDLIWCPVRL